MSDTFKKPTTGAGRPAISDLKKNQMRRDIADIAKRLFQDEGFDTISLRRIANEMGCSPMTLYKYYDAKIDILRTLWGDVFAELFKQLEDAAQAKDRQLLALGRAYVHYWLDHPEYYRLVFIADGVTQSDVTVFLEHPELVPRFDIFAHALIISNAGSLSEEELKQRLETFICFLNGIAHNLITISGYAWSDPDKMVARAVTAVLD
jgi:AcrR family transcriptional regulator